MMEFIKEKPLATASATVSAVIAILGAFWAFDSHYATAADLQTVQKNFSIQISQDRASDLDDKIFALQLKKNQQGGKLSAIDEAMLERYTRQYQEIQDRINKSMDSTK